MATVIAPVSEHSTLPEQVKEEVQDEVKPVEDKPSELLTNEEVKKADVIAEPEEKTEDKEIEPSLIEEPKINDEAAKPVAVEIPSPAASLAETEEKIEDKNIDHPIIEEKGVEVKKAEVDLPVQESEPVVTEEETPKPVPTVQGKPEEQTEKEVAVVEQKESVNLGTLLKEDASIKVEPIKTETVVDFPKVDEKSKESTQTISRDVELVAENEKEVIKEQVVAALTNGDDAVINETTKESVEEEPKKNEGEVKGEETLLTEESKVSEDIPKEEVKAKSLISKVKSSLVKAKKAIIGKSPTPKATATPTPDAKDEVKV